MKLPTFRAATLDDAELAADLITAAYPDLPEDPVLLRYRWEHPREEFARGRFIADLDGRPIALVAWLHGPWEKLPERHCEVEVSLDQKLLAPELLDHLWTWAGMQAEAAGARQFLSFAAEDEHEVLASLERLGYTRDRTDKMWELDLRANGKRLLSEAAEARERAAQAGIELHTMAEWDDPEKMVKLHALDSLTRQDIPHSLPILPMSLEDFVRRSQSPDRRADRYWIARHGARPVAVSYLRYPPVRGAVWTGYTCCHPEYRGRGLARAVKLQSLAQAVELGATRVCTENDSENAPMLHINEALGYHLGTGFVALLKRVQT